MQIIIRMTGVCRPEQGARRADDALFHRLHHWLQLFSTRAPFSHLHSSYLYGIPGVSFALYISWLCTNHRIRLPHDLPNAT